ncbi:MAG: SGNH/GDSL hydrolase family protein [Opitutaceae bacterium]|nr:SGNH/GDSL hydrolase family protein [Opitutaceae bacterium]
MAAALAAAEAAEAAPLPDLERLRQKLGNQEVALTWVFTGDSITQGAGQVGPERAYPEIVHERVRFELRRRRDLFINAGFSGETADRLLQDFDWRVTRFQPAVVSVMFGMNDCVAGPEGREAFGRNLREIVRRVRALGAIPILHTLDPIDSADPMTATRSDLPAYSTTVKTVAEKEAVILIDHWAHWTEARPSLAALREWLGDPFHPNGAGHRQFAILFFQAIGIYDPAKPACRP